MHRREILAKGALALGSMGIAGVGGALAAEPKTSRVACTTTTFRGRFPEMSLLDFPSFVARRLGLSKIEIWSKHFTDSSPEYCAKLKDAAERAGSRVINIQLDQPGYNLSDPDPAKRAESVEFVKSWMDRAKACGASSLRANTGGRKGAEFEIEVTGDAFAQLARHGREIGVVVLVENHGGHSAKAENVAAIVKAAASKWCRSLPDFGNFEGPQKEREAFLGKLLPHAHLISAKGKDFDAGLKHLPYDIGACVRLAEAAGFKGVYSIEQWSRNEQPVGDLAIAERIRDIILKNLA